jgi:hypothetical protein
MPPQGHDQIGVGLDRGLEQRQVGAHAGDDLADLGVALDLQAVGGGVLDLVYLERLVEPGDDFLERDHVGSSARVAVAEAYRTPGGSRKTEDGRQTTEDGRRKTEDGRRTTEDGGRRTGDGMTEGRSGGAGIADRDLP